MLAIRLCSIVSLCDNQILGPIVVLARQVALEDGLCAEGIALLCVERGARHVGHHGISAAKGVLGVAEDVVFGCGLGCPDVATVAAEMTGFERGSDVFLDDNGAASSVDEPGSYCVLV